MDVREILKQYAAGVRDFSGANLTGAKLYAVSRFGLKTEGMTCKWVDLSPNGDHSEILDFSTEGSTKFFSETLPTVRIIVDAPLDFHANLALATVYDHIAHVFPVFTKAPSIDIGVRRTAVTFSIGSNVELFTIAYLAILPFNDAVATHQNILALVNMLQAQDLKTLGSKESQRIRQLITTLNRSIDRLDSTDPCKEISGMMEPVKFFQAPTHVLVSNSRAQTLSIYNNPAFGKYLTNQSNLLEGLKNSFMQTPESMLPPVGTVIEFIKAFDYVGQSRV